MHAKWDVSVPSVNIWQECLRVLKPGAFAFIMSSPRQDVLSRMIINISDAGFDTNFTSIYWAYNTGFPKAQNISKVLDKRAGAKQTVIGNYQAPVTEEAKAFDGAYTGYQPKPAVEVVIVAMKPINENTYADQALKNGHGCTWLDNCRIPYRNEADLEHIKAKMAQNPKQGRDMFNGGFKKHLWTFDKKIGRFPTNILCENDSMNNRRKTPASISPNLDNKIYPAAQKINCYGKETTRLGYSDSGSYSRYFSLEAWFEKYISKLPQEVQNTFPFLITPKPSVNEKERNLDIIHKPSNRPSGIAYNEHSGIHSERESNIHPTIKPLKLMMWLIVLGTQEDDTVLDPFMGSGTTPIAAKATHRIYKGIEIEKEFYDISIKRIDEMQKTIESFL
jgi:site-specific DNA-methyltransferase (adenine-specific)